MKFENDFDFTKSVRLVHVHDTWNEYSTLYWFVSQLQAAFGFRFVIDITRKNVHVLLFDHDRYVYYNTIFWWAQAYSNTPLMEAASNGHIDCVNLLLERGASTEATCKVRSYQYIDFHGVARTHRYLLCGEVGDHIDMCTCILYTEFVSINSHTQYNGKTALICAAMNGHLHCSRLLMNYANKEAVDLVCWIDAQRRSYHVDP